MRRELAILLGALAVSAAGTAAVIWLNPTQMSPEDEERAGQRLIAGWRELGGNLFLARHDREAELMFRRIIRVAPGDVHSRRMLGLVLYRTGRFEEAAELFRQVAMVRERDAVARNNLGMALVGAGQFESGIRELLRAERWSGGAAYVCANLAEAYLRLGDETRSNYFRRRASQAGERDGGRVPPEAVGSEAAAAKPRNETEQSQ